MYGCAVALELCMTGDMHWKEICLQWTIPHIRISRHHLLRVCLADIPRILVHHGEHRHSLLSVVMSLCDRLIQLSGRLEKINHCCSKLCLYTTGQRV